MGLFEWFGERYNPGGIGGVYVGAGEHGGRPRWVVLVRFLIAAALVAVVYGLLFTYLLEPTGKAVAWAVGIGLAYCLAAYFVRPEADTSNLGWLGGLVDHPFRFSDDINRFLLISTIILWPGRFVAESLIDVFAASLKAHRRA